MAHRIPTAKEHDMRQKMVSFSVVAALIVVPLLALIPNATRALAAAQASAVTEMPTFQLDPTWPKKLPNNWILGPASGLTVDSQDHIWVITRPREVMNAAQKTGQTAPSVIEFDPQGNYVQGWGGPGDGYEWPVTEHGITVDSKGFVWIAGRRNKDHKIWKF